MIKLFFLQIVALFAICIILDWLRLIINKFHQKEFKLRLIDSMPILALIFIHQLTINPKGFSWDPVLIIGWMFIGILVLIHKAFTKHQLSHKNFYRTLWRIGDLYFLVAWIFAGIVSTL
ncbi:DUF3397 family protein [Acetilactobacillus jinshanensis]|uniref:DUF3397 family protein n=1 Tax=Acetilactobacillus jinshanensis TaxID=1720083 RepID=UPI0013A65492|nr:DUF3397 family protein [Acetilactobacillus jinshanensis]URL60754.1 DUF3397 family protein [uncultured bacterium]